MLAVMERLAKVMAFIGGVVLIALVVTTTISVTGRGLNTLGHWSAFAEAWAAAANWFKGFGPLDGDVEIVEMGVAFAIFSFMPICQLYGAHATVDIFTNALPRPIVRGLIAFWELVLSAVIILIAWQLYEAMLSKMETGESSYRLAFPDWNNDGWPDEFFVWYAYAASFAAASVAALVALYCAAARVITLATGAKLLPTDQGAES